MPSQPHRLAELGQVTDFHRKIDQMNTLAWELAESLPTRALEIYQQVIGLLTENPHMPYPKGQADALVAMAAAERMEGRYASCVQHSMEALTLYQRVDNPTDSLSRAYYNLGVAYNRMGNYPASQEAHLHQLEMAEAADDVMAKCAALRNIGLLYARLGDHHEALRNYAQCENLLAPDHPFLGGVFNNHCRSYYALGELDKALDYGHKGIALFAADHNIIGQSRIHANISRVYTKLERYEEAEAHLAQSMNFALEANNLFSKLLIHTYRGELYLRQGRFPEAIQETTNALWIAVETQGRLEEAECYHLLGQIYERVADWPNALTCYRKFVAIKDALFNEENLARIRSIAQTQRIRQAQAEAETQRRLREQERHHAERLLKMKDEFLNAATHDLKNPLAVIAMAVYKLRRYVPTDNDPAHETLNRIDSTLIHMRDLIADLLDIARLQTGYVLNCEQADLVTLVRTVIDDFQELAERKTITVAYHAAQPEMNTLFDTARMRQVIANLVSNAINYTPEGGRVNVTIESRPQEFWIRIIDNGMGIPEQDLPRLFEVFFRGSNQQGETEGTGLGLAISRSIVEQHNGLIWAESTLGVGSTFTVVLPAV